MCLFLLTGSHTDTGVPVKPKSNVRQPLFLAHRRSSRIRYAVPPKKERRVEPTGVELSPGSYGSLVLSLPGDARFGVLGWGADHPRTHSPQSHWSSESHLRTRAAASYRRSASPERPMGAERTGRPLMRMEQYTDADGSGARVGGSGRH